MPFGSMKFLWAPIYLYYIINSQEIKKLNSTNSSGNVIENIGSRPSGVNDFWRGHSKQQKTNFNKQNNNS
jgi:hypothetical protein